MNLASHVLIASRISKNSFSFPKRCLIMIGSLLPDFNPTTQPHRTQNLLDRINNNYKALDLDENNFVKSIRFGVMLHYICDYYCYAHNYNLEISHGIKHMEYEVQLHQLLKDGYYKRRDNQSIEDFAEYIVTEKEEYDSIPSDIDRDLLYTLSVVDRALREALPKFSKEPEIIDELLSTINQPKAVNEN